MNDYEGTRRIVTWARIGQEIDAKTAAAMISQIDKAEQKGEPCPGYATMESELRVTA